MDRYYIENMEHLKDYLSKYENMSEEEKLENKFHITDCFEAILSPKYLNKYNRKELLKIHEMILKLENLYSLITFDKILINSKYFLEYINIIKEDINNVILFAKRNIHMFITEGIEYQLKNKDIYPKNPFDFNNQLLNEYENYIIESTLDLLEFLEDELQEHKINIDIMTLFYQDFTTEQLAFIYAQLQYYLYDGLRFRNGCFERGTQEKSEKIYDAMRKRSDEEKFKFINSIYEFGYCNVAMGTNAMIVELLRTTDISTICWRLSNIIESNKHGVIKPDTSNDIYNYIRYSKRIKELRDKDIENKKPIKTIYAYELDVTNYENRKRFNR